MDTKTPTQYPLSFEILEGEKDDTIVLYKVPSKDNNSKFSNRISPFPFIISLGLPLLQVGFVILAIFTPLLNNTPYNDLWVLLYIITSASVCAVGMVVDAMGVIIAVLGIRKSGDEKCIVALLLNLLLLLPRALIFFLIH